MRSHYNMPVRKWAHVRTIVLAGDVGPVVAAAGDDERREPRLHLLLRPHAPAQEELFVRRDRHDPEVSASLRRTSLLRPGILCLSKATPGVNVIKLFTDVSCDFS